VNPSKAKGTLAETAVVRFARDRGFPGADRLPLRGTLDGGDVGLCPGVIVEVKAGKAAQQMSLGQLGAWMDDTERERVNAGAELGLLVTQRRGIGPGRVGSWCAWLREDGRVVMMSLEDALVVLRGRGWGDPL